MDSKNLVAATAAMGQDVITLNNAILEYDGKIDTLYKLLDELALVDWKGTDGKLFENRIREKRTFLIDISNTLKEYARTINDSATDMDDTQGGIAGQINSL